MKKREEIYNKKNMVVYQERKTVLGRTCNEESEFSTKSGAGTNSGRGETLGKTKIKTGRKIQLRGDVEELGGGSD